MASVFKIRHKPSRRFAKKDNYDPLNITDYDYEQLIFTRKPPIGDVWNTFKLATKFMESIPYIYTFRGIPKMSSNELEVV